MQQVLLLLLLISAQFSFGQDSLFFKNGKVLAVQIIELDSLANLVGYIDEGDTIYASIRSFDRVVHAGKESSFGLANSAVVIAEEKAKGAVRDQVKLNPKYAYSKWAISTNITGMFSSDSRIVYSANSVFSIEPEYFVNNHFSLKMPIHIGIPTKDLNRLNYGYGPYRMDNYSTDYLPYVKGVDNWNDLGHKRDLLFQFGLNPKFYFKGQRNFGWYLSQGLYMSQINLDRVDYYYTYEQYVGGFDTYWDAPEIAIETFDEKRWIFRYEGAIGLSINIFKRIGLTSELGYTTLIKSANEGVDQVFIREGDNPYVLDPFLVNHEVDYRSNQTLAPYFRIHLVHRFGGVKNVVK
jgi:hypothetical protein